jgi:hypothetical protein
LKSEIKFPSIKILRQYQHTEECYEIARCLSRDFPQLKFDSGFYVKDGYAADHAWTVIDGTIVDTTHGQFDPKIPILIAKRGSKAQARYYSYSQHHNPECLHRKFKVSEACQVDGCDYNGNEEST